MSRDLDALGAEIKEISEDHEHKKLHASCADLLAMLSRLDVYGGQAELEDTQSSLLGMSEEAVTELFERIRDGQWDSKQYRELIVETLHTLAYEANSTALARINWPDIARAYIDPNKQPMDAGLQDAIDYSNRLEKRLREATFGQAESLEEVENIFRCLDAVAAQSLEAGDFSTATVIGVVLFGSETRALVTPHLDGKLHWEEWLVKAGRGDKARKRAGTEFEDIRKVAQAVDDHQGYTQRLRSATEGPQAAPVIPKVSYHHAKLSFAYEKLKGEASIPNLAEYADHVRDFRRVVAGLRSFGNVELHGLFTFLLGG